MRVFHQERGRLAFVLLVVLTVALQGIWGTAPALANGTSASTKPRVSLTLSASTSTVGATLHARVRTGAKVARAVQLQLRGPSGWTRVSVGKVNRRGSTTLAFDAPSVAGTATYRVLLPKVRVRGKSLKQVASAPASLVVTTIPSRLTGQLSATRLQAGQTVVVTGNVAPAAVRPVRLERRGSGEWSTVSHSESSAAGDVTLTDQPPQGVWTYRLVAGPTSRYAEAGSPVMSAEVTPGPASFQVVVLHAPTGAGVTVTAPTGEERTIAETTVFADAAPGVWRVNAGPVHHESETTYAVEPDQQASVAAGQATSTIVDYGVTIPDSTSVIAPGDIASVEDLADGVVKITFTDPAAAAARARVASRVRTARLTLRSATVSAAARADAQATLYGCNSSTDPTNPFVFCPGDYGAVGVTKDLPNGKFGRVPSGGVGTNWALLDPNGATLSAALKDAATASAEKAIGGNTSGSIPDTPINCSAEATASVGASFTLDPRLDFGLKISDHGIAEAHALVKINQSADVTASLTGKASCTLDPRDLITPRQLPPIVITLGGVFPVVLVPELDVNIAATISANGQIGVGWHQTSTGSFGLSYTSGGGFAAPPGLQTPTPTYNATPTFNGELKASVKITPSIAIKAYGIAGPKVGLELGLTGTASLEVGSDGAGSLAWALTGQGDLKASVESGPINLPVTAEWVILSLKDWDIAHGRYPWSPPSGFYPSITTSTLPDATSGTAYQTRLTTADNRAGRWDRTGGTLPPGLSLDPDNGQITGTPTAAGSWSFTVSFTDGWGHSTSKALDVEVVDPNRLTLPNGFIADAPYGAQIPDYTADLDALVDVAGTWTVLDQPGHSVPPGITVGADGAVTGRPTQGGPWDFYVVHATADGVSTTYRVGLAVSDIYLSGQCDFQPGKTSIVASWGLNYPFAFAPVQVTARLDGEVVVSQQVPGDPARQSPVGHFWQDLPSGTTYTAAITVGAVTISDEFSCPPP